jgi:hypothetical protein
MKIYFKKSFCFVSLICLFSTYTYACRPLVIDDCPIVEKNKISIETGILSSRDSSSDNSFNETTSLKYGLIKNVDVGIDIPFLFIKDNGSYNNDIGDLTIKSKIRVIDFEKNCMGLSFVISSKLDNADSDRGFGSGFVDYSINTITTKSISKGFIHTNLGYTFVGDDNLDNTWLYGCSFEYPAIYKMRILGELIGSTNSEPSSNDDYLAAQIGFNKEIGSIIFDMGVSFGLTKQSPENTYTIGLTMQI